MTITLATLVNLGSITKTCDFTRALEADDSKMLEWLHTMNITCAVSFVNLLHAGMLGVKNRFPFLTSESVMKNKYLA